MSLLDLICDTEEEKQKILNSFERDKQLTEEHLQRDDIPMPDGSWKSFNGNSRFEFFLKSKGI